MKRLNDRITASPVFRRVASGVGANLLGRVWILLTQLITVPVLSYYWGVGGYGVWIMISTIPTYLALSDFGLSAAAGVEMTRAISEGNRDEALCIYRSAWVFLSAITIGLGAVVCLGALVWLSLGGPQTQPFSRSEIAVTIILTTVAALLYIQVLFQRMVFDATHKYALGGLLFDLNFLLGGLSLMVAAWAGGQLIAAAAAQVTIRATLYLVTRGVIRRLEPWWRPRKGHYDRTTVRRLMRPSMASFILSLAQSFGVQGVVLTLGFTLGPAATAIFNTSRMLTRAPLQFALLTTRASLPELTRAQTAGDTALTRRLMKLNTGLVLAVMGPAALAFTLAGPWLLDKLSHGQMETGRLAFFLLALSAAICAIWMALGTRLMAMNRQGTFAYLALGLYAAVALVPFIPGMSYTAILTATVLAEAGIALRVVMWKGGKS